MKKTNIKTAIAWIMVAAWMVVIFRLSAQTADDSGGLSEAVLRWIVDSFFRGFEQLRQEEILAVLHTVIRKGAHFTEYAILAMLVANAIRNYPLSTRLQWLLPVGVSALYAVTDEIHQYFVPGRACMAMDVGIDTCGAIVGTAVFMLIAYLIRKRHCCKMRKDSDRIRRGDY